MDVKDRAPGQVGGRIVEKPPLPGRFFDESDDDIQGPAGGLEFLEDGIGMGVEGRLLDQIPETVAGQAQLGENDQVGFFPAGFLDGPDMEFEVLLDVPQRGRDLGQGDLHTVKLAQFPRLFNETGPAPSLAYFFRLSYKEIAHESYSLFFLV